MANFQELYKKFTLALLDNMQDIPHGVYAIKAPNIMKRFGVYRNNVMASLIEAMKANFPIVNALVGDDFFTGMVVAFISANPPREPMLFKYGSDFAGFIAEFSHADPIPYLSDVARLEDNWRLAYHSADIDPIDASGLENIDADAHMDIVFKIHPSVSIIKSGWPIYDIWAGHEVNDMGKIDLEQSDNVVIFRPSVDVIITKLKPSDCLFFRQIFNGKTLGEAFELTVAEYHDFDLGHSFGQLFAMGLVVGMRVK